MGHSSRPDGHSIRLSRAPRERLGSGTGPFSAPAMARQALLTRKWSGTCAHPAPGTSIHPRLKLPIPLPPRRGWNASILRLSDALDQLLASAGSDLLISAGSEPRIRKDGQLVAISEGAEPITP